MLLEIEDMEFLEALGAGLIQHWQVCLVSVVLIVAAVIDGIQLKVPNWLTFPMIISGWVYAMVAYQMNGEGWYVGLGWSLFGTAVGLGLLLPAYAIGGMGAGDVKLLAGVGAWLFVQHTFYAFCATCVVGAVMAVVMVLLKGKWKKHKDQFFHIANEIVTIKNPEELAKIAADRKPSMMLLPYGIPMCIGALLYFAIAGMMDKL